MSGVNSINYPHSNIAPTHITGYADQSIYCNELINRLTYAIK
jgi:hypothetical protein